MSAERLAAAGLRKQISIRLGVLAPPLAEQLTQLPPDTAKNLDDYRRSINLLRIHSILTPAETERAEKRLVARILAALEEVSE